MTTISLGALSFDWEGPALRCVTWRGTELVRLISSPVRGVDWGTLDERLLGEESRLRATCWRHERRTSVAQGDQQARVTLSIEATGDAERARVVVVTEIESPTGLDTNRAGLCLLHPLEGVRDRPMRIQDSAGDWHTITMPGADEIRPDQPVRDLVGSEQRIGSARLAIRFDGEIFEMEDQRNWTDASYKTYCRPLSAPRPFRLTPHAPLRQTITLDIGDAVGADPGATPSPQTDAATTFRLPERLLALEPGWFADGGIACDGWTARLSDERDWQDADLAQLGDRCRQRGHSLGVEIEVPARLEPHECLTRWKRRLTALGVVPDRVVALPSAYLSSYQPDGEWPSGPTPDELVPLVRNVFPDAQIGTGSLTYFTELNRCRPATNDADYLTFGTAAIVHAADTRSVFETLEALPDVFASAARIAHPLPCRLGLVAIGMRSNPYGDGLADPLPSGFTTMTDRDSRHVEAAGAAFAVAATLLAARAGIRSLCLGAPAGPFALLQADGAPTPLGAALDLLAAFGDVPVTIEGQAPGVLTVRSETEQLRVNASPHPAQGLAPYALEHPRSRAGALS